MPCDTYRKPGQTLAERIEEVRTALRALEQKLQTGKVGITIGNNGAMQFTNWSAQDRAGVTDVCAYRTLLHENSWALRQAVARAEALQGRRVNLAAVASGLHSHDGGRTWSRH